jgi:hypothetical protein
MAVWNGGRRKAKSRRAAMNDQQKEGLALLRKPFDAKLISRLPKPTKAQTDAVKADYKAGMRCQICGTWHHKDVVHLDYVGHAALTDRLLDADPEWNWEPVATNTDGSPVLDKDGGMWIKLTVCGITRLGYGDAEGKTGPAATKERIGDALRNAAMRFGAALDLWSKVDLHFDEHEDAANGPPVQPTAGKPEPKVLPTYDAAKFSDTLPTWRAAISAGRNTADGIIKRIETAYTMTDEQRAAIKAALANAEQLAAIRQNAADLGVPESEICGRFGVASLEVIQESMVAEVLEFLSGE